MTQQRTNALPQFILCFHGCTDKKAKDVLKSGFPPSGMEGNKGDWLSTGVYFWQDNFRQARWWAEEVCRREEEKTGKKYKPAVLFSIIKTDSSWLDLFDHEHIEYLKDGYELLCSSIADLNKKLEETLTDPVRKIAINMGLIKENSRLPLTVCIPMPTNQGIAHSLDDAVINTTVKFIELQTGNKVKGVRSVFVTGGAVYKDANFFNKPHIQIVVRKEKKAQKDEDFGIIETHTLTKERLKTVCEKYNLLLENDSNYKF